MGIHDYITIEYELPVKLPKEGWQTKALDCNGNSFILTEDGRLFERIRAIELLDGVVHETGKWKLIDRNFEGVFAVYNMVFPRTHVIVVPGEDLPVSTVSGIASWFEYEIVMIDGDVKQVRRK